LTNRRKEVINIVAEKGTEMNCYYAIQVVTGQEKRIKELYAKYYCTHALFASTQVLIPQQLVRRKVKHNYKNTWSPLWPGYVLIKCAEMTDELYYMLKHINGVIRVLKSAISVQEFDNVLRAKLSSKFMKRLQYARQLLQRGCNGWNKFQKRLGKRVVMGAGLINHSKENKPKSLVPLRN